MRALDTAGVAAWAAGCLSELGALRADIDSINVYPVADSDTGSNLLHTFAGAHDALERAAPASACGAFAALSRGAIDAARGNSGVILAQALRGMAQACDSGAEVDGVVLVNCLAEADLLAKEAVARPVEGTMLTVLHEASRAATHAGQGTLAEAALAASDAAARALERTQHQLSALRSAGVVDAGGRGVLAILDRLVSVVTGRPVEARPEFHISEGHRSGPVQAGTDTLPDGSQPWEVMYLLDDLADDAVPELRENLSALGDSVTIAGDGAGQYAVHVHCADIGGALEAGLAVGRPRNVRVESLAGSGDRRQAHSVAPRAMLAVVEGRDLAELCSQAGARVLEVSGNDAVGSGQIRQSIDGVPAAHVTVLPGGSALTRLAEEAADATVDEDTDVVVIPCSSPVQVLAAIAVHDGARKVSDDVVAMAEAAAATHRGELSIATADAITWVGRVSSGDLVGFVDDEVVLIEQAGCDTATAAGAAMTLLERMLGVGGELVTVLLGAMAPDGIDGEIAGWLRAAHPEIEYVAYQGGQMDTVLAIGVE